MRTVWTFDEFDGNMTQRDLIMLLASCKLWSIHCPQDYRVLYCNDALGNLLESLGKINLFDEVNSLSNLPEFSINPKVFWAYPKLRVLLIQQEPVTLVDHDFFVYDNIREFVDPNKICFNYREDARGYYPSLLDPYVKQLSFKGRWPNYACNVSFLQLPDVEWYRFYAGMSLQIMEEFTNMNVPNSLYLVFAEQLLLSYLLKEDYQCLLKDVYCCRSNRWYEGNLEQKGIWTRKEADWKKCIHYGQAKKSWPDKEKEVELNWLLDYSGLGKELLQEIRDEHSRS